MFLPQIIQNRMFHLDPIFVKCFGFPANPPGPSGVISLVTELFILYVKDCYAPNSTTNKQWPPNWAYTWTCNWQSRHRMRTPRELRIMKLISRLAVQTLEIKAAVRACGCLTTKPCWRSRAVTSGLHLWMSQLELVSHHEASKVAVGLFFSQISLPVCLVKLNC